MNSNTQPQNTLALVIGEITVLQDEEGRYSLNDLHAASGGVQKSKPGNWMQTQQFKELVAELDAELIAGKDVLIAGIPAIKTVAGRYGGTYVVKELVYAYAMWISALFSLQVIRGYDAMVAHGRSNLTADINLSNYIGIFKLRIALMEKLSCCTDNGVGKGIYSNLLQVSRLIGQTTDSMDDLAPGLRQKPLPLQGGAA